MSGMTNVGTHRKPSFPDCQPCDARVIEGHLWGNVVGAEDQALKGCQIMGTYRIKSESFVIGGNGRATGVLDGVIICPCQP